MALVIRAAAQNDLDALGRLGAMLMRTHYAFDPQRFLTPGDEAEIGYARFLGHVLDSPAACVLVAEDEGVLLGYIYAELEPMSWKELRGPAGFIHDLAVEEAHRRSRVGEMLMRAGIDWLRMHGAPRVVLGTAAANDTAQRLFERLGFRRTMVEMTLEL